MKRKRIFPTIAVVAVIVLSLLVLTGCCNLPHETIQAQDTIPDNNQQTIPDETILQQNDVQQINSRKAKEIAVDFIGYGVVHDIQAFMYEENLIFEVDVRNDSTRYVVLLNAENGNVKSLNRHEQNHAIADTSQGSAYFTDNFDSHDECTIQIINEPTGQPEPQTPRASATPSPTASPQPAQQPQSPQPAASPSTGGRSSTQSSTTISLNRAIEIANADLKSRGINATYRSNSGLDWERGQQVWELLYTTHGERMPLIEYYINAENGSIVKFEWDD